MKDICDEYYGYGTGFYDKEASQQYARGAMSHFTLCHGIKLSIEADNNMQAPSISEMGKLLASATISTHQ